MLIWGSDMQIEIYTMTYNDNSINISLEAVCDSFSSLLWDIEYYKCGSFEIYISATPQNLDIFQTGRIVGRDDDREHFGIIESIQLETDTEKGDYLTISGRFLMCLLERRIIYPTLSFTSLTSYSDIVRKAVQENAINIGNRNIPSLSLGSVSGICWESKTKLQISYANLMEWIYTICETVGGTANIRLNKLENEQYEMLFELSQGSDRSIMQEENPHIIFSDSYSNLLSFNYATDTSVQKNIAYVLGQGEGEERKRTTYFNGDEPTLLDRYEIYVDAKDISGETQQPVNPDNPTEKIVIDDELSETSENPVKNKVITLELQKIKNMISDIKEQIDSEITGNKLSGLVCSDFIGLSECISGDLAVIESEG